MTETCFHLGCDEPAQVLVSVDLIEMDEDGVRNLGPTDVAMCRIHALAEVPSDA